MKIEKSQNIKFVVSFTTGPSNVLQCLLKTERDLKMNPRSQ